MRHLYIPFILMFLTIKTSWAYERSDAFVVKMFDKSIKVLAPAKYDPKLHVILENKTLMKSLSRLERANGKVIKYITVEPGKFTSVELKSKKGEVLYLVPMAPPFQKVELTPGKKAYEIPPQR